MVSSVLVFFLKDSLWNSISISILGMSFLLKKLLRWQMKHNFEVGVYWCNNKVPPTLSLLSTSLGRYTSGIWQQKIIIPIFTWYCIYLVELWNKKNRFFILVAFVLTIPRMFFRVNICCIYYSIHSRTKPHNTPTTQ